MKKMPIYALALALALSLTACSQPNAEQPTDPTSGTSAPEPIQDTTPEPEENTIPEPEPEQTPAAPVSFENTQPSEETESEETESQEEKVPLFTDCDETVYATGTVNIRASYTAESDKLGSLSAGDSIIRTGTSIAGTEAEGWSRVQLSDGTAAYISNQYLSATKPAVQQQQPSESSPQSKPTDEGQQQTQQPQQQLQTPPQQSQSGEGGGGDSAADIEARKKAFIDGMEQMFEDHGYSAGGSDHAMTDEEFEAMKKALGW